MKISALVVVLLLAACTAFANEIAYHSKNGHFYALIDSSWKESFEIQKEFEDAIKTRREHLATLYFNEVVGILGSGLPFWESWGQDCLFAICRRNSRKVNLTLGGILGKGLKIELA